MVFLALIEIIPLVRDVSRDNIECPDDIIAYNCSIQSNSEAVHLTWRVTLPGEEPISTTYPNARSNRTSLNSYIATFLTGFRSEEFIYSTLEVTVQRGMSADEIVAECLIDELGNNTIIIRVNISGTSISTK